MAFKIKDLMISDLSEGAHAEIVCGHGHSLCGVHQFSCQLHSKILNYGCDNGCTNIPTPPGYAAEFVIGGGIPCDVCTYIVSLHGTVTVTITPFTPVISPVRATSGTGLSTLKDQLKQQLAEVEKQEAAAQASLQPQTVEEVDTLTKKLQEALEELKARRAELSK
jgi:hypothetical protein